MAVHQSGADHGGRSRRSDLGDQRDAGARRGRPRGGHVAARPGRAPFKDLDRPEHLFQVVADGLPSEFPPLRTEDAPTAYTGLEDELTEAARTAIAAAAAAATALPAVRRRRRSDRGCRCDSDLRVRGRRGRGLERPFPSRLTRRSLSTAARERSLPRFPSARGLFAPQPARVPSGSRTATRGTVSRIDPVKHTVVQTIEVGSGPAGIAVGAGAVWVTNGLSGTLSRISPGFEICRTHTSAGRPARRRLRRGRRSGSRTSTTARCPASTPRRAKS